MQSALLRVVVVVAVAPRSPPSPIPGIRLTRAPDMPCMSCSSHIALSLLSFHVLTSTSTSLALAANDNAMPSILSRSLTSNERRERTPEDQGERSYPSHILRRHVPPPPPSPWFPNLYPSRDAPSRASRRRLSSLAASATLCAYILEKLSDARRANHLRCLSCVRLPLSSRRGGGT